LAELNGDPAWREKLIKNWARDSSAEKSLFDSLTRRIAGQAAAEAPAQMPADPQEAGLIKDTTPPDDPSAYRVRYVDPPEAPGVAETAKQAQGWLHDAGVPLQVGEDIIAEAVKEIPQLRNLPEAERDKHVHSSWQQIERILGQNSDAYLDAADRLLNRLERQRPGLKTFLSSSGLIDSPTFIFRLASHAVALERRQQRARR
jgi:hypothetical protein